MLLAIDIGNTAITFGLFRNRRLVKRWWISTAKIGNKLFRKGDPQIAAVSAVIISSVAPRVLAKLKKKLTPELGLRPWVVGQDLKVDIVNRYRRPKQVGSDRLVNAVAGYKIYGGPLIIVDFGTAVTFDLISKKGEYLGGIIVPGIDLSLEALWQKAALLPAVKLSRPKSLIGLETKQSMISGIVYGFSSLCDGLISRLKKLSGPKTKVIATGGRAKMIVPYCKEIFQVNSDLTLKGLELIYRNYENK